MKSTIIFSILALLISIPIAFIISPKPAAWLVQQLFKDGVAVAPENYAELFKNVSIQANIDYPSEFKDNQLDIISPKNNNKPLPTIIWIHGGAFVGGDKKDVTEYAVQIAHEGYHIVNMNYELAPSAQYPTPLKQVAEVYSFLLENKEQYQFDVTNIFIAGDSAGAQIAAQFTAIQTDSQYAEQVGLPQIILAENLRGVLLFCGPYEIQKLSNMSENKLVAFLLNKVAWAYIGERDWINSENARLASPIDHVTAAYPPTFLTDGNTASFEKHARALEERLIDLNIDVTSKFYDTSLGHEYQFIMNTPEAEETLQAVHTFLNTFKNNK